MLISFFHLKRGGGYLRGGGLNREITVCATCLDSEYLHFASKSVEILQASLYHWSLMD